MFANLIDRIAEYPRQSLLVAMGLAVILFQLIFLGMLANGEVRKAEMRQASVMSQRMAMARCVETNNRRQIDSCMALASANADRNPGESPVAYAAYGSPVVSSAGGSVVNAGVQMRSLGNTKPQGSSGGVMPVAYMIR